MIKFMSRLLTNAQLEKNNFNIPINNSRVSKLIINSNQFNNKYLL